MFQFGRFALLQYTFSILGFPIRKSTDQFVCANTRSLSQLITSFIASESLGIPRVLLFTFFIKLYIPIQSCRCLYLLFSLSITSSNMSKNFSKYLSDIPLYIRI